MTTQPIEHHDPHDPARILDLLPTDQREVFLREYRAAAVSAAHEVWRYRHLQELLKHWSMRAAIYSSAGHDESRRQAETGLGEFTTLDDLVADRQDS
ncbi:DUF6247 family protein [Nocardiopsis suaedae]|uniref:DUF6247 family protein n=1 Tax=Nocardiopsis suaedae TaxID=3018444 RepID=A0ABT4TW86_9ACTN|nr:DUF6247 family protein [Nocardiopsis suaedae]MDA2808953.1 DUF6247 family protein [Nocardiopsis suaedae]